MSDRPEMMKIYGLISDALSACDDAAYRAGNIGEYEVQHYCQKALEALDKAERLF